ncbi:MAG: metal-dependent hydrolase [Flavobacteriales bacterium]|nr:metal-dependent hydrolase [Flavobacteriales bacterium]
MASVFAHIISGYALGDTVGSEDRKLLWIGAALACLPDIDVIGWFNGIGYESVYGHRGFTHSIFFAVVLGGLVSLFFKQNRLKAWLICSLCLVSHGLLDAMTTGGRGIAFWWPFDDSRHFLPWRVIKVSPIGISSFFSEWGWKVLKSEAVYVGIPSLLMLAFNWMRRRKDPYEHEISP